MQIHVRDGCSNFIFFFQQCEKLLSCESIPVKVSEMHVRSCLRAPAETHPQFCAKCREENRSQVKRRVSA